MTSWRPPCTEEAETLPAGRLQTLVDELYKNGKPANVTESLIRERREAGG